MSNLCTTPERIRWNQWLGVDAGRGACVALVGIYTSQSQSQPDIPYPVGTGADGMTGGGACAVLMDLVEF